MAWFWSSRKDEDDEYEEYEDESDEDGSYESYTDEEDEVGVDIVQAAEDVEILDPQPHKASTADDEADGLHAEELALLTAHAVDATRAAPTTEGAVVWNTESLPDELLTAGVIPSVVVGGTRTNRFSSAVSDMDDDFISDAVLPPLEATTATPMAAPAKDANPKSTDMAPDEEETTLSDKQSLLVLAAEHDRVDILQAILASSSGSTAPEAALQRAFLLNPVVVVDNDSTFGIVATIPPLHIAVSYGSVNAVNALLRLGADPSLRPDVPVIRAAAVALDDASSSAVEIPRMNRFHNQTAWELAFGEEDGPSMAVRGTSWSLFRSPSDHDRSHTTLRQQPPPVDMAPSKREGIRHAFTAEALRCIGSDEGPRLRQLLDAGLPGTTEIGGKTLWDWSVDMGAVTCQTLLPNTSHMTDTVSDADAEAGSTVDAADAPPTTPTASTTMDAGAVKKSAVLDRGSHGASLSDLSLVALTNRLVELESLSQALSLCLDNLAEEVSVCAGLLLVGSGSASALATHVRSLKTRRAKQHDEWQRLVETNDNSQDELIYWIKQWELTHGSSNGSSSMSGSVVVNDILSLVQSEDAKLHANGAATPIPVDAVVVPEAVQQQQLRAQIEAMEHKIRRLRAAIADLSEENARNLDAVEQRGLSGGIHLVRTLRDEIRDLEYHTTEVTSDEAACRAKIRLVQAKVKSGKPLSLVDANTNANTNDARADTANANFGHGTVETDMPDSERIAQGHSTALVVRGATGTRGFLPFNIWQILLRIMGMSDPSRPHIDIPTPSTPVMII